MPEMVENKLIEIKLNKYRRLLVEEEFIVIIREEAESEENKRTLIRYEELKVIRYRHSEIHTFISLICIVVMVFLDLGGNPFLGENARVEIFYKDGRIKIEDLESYAENKMLQITKEINNRIKKARKLKL